MNAVPSQKRYRYIGAYLVIECFRNAEIPIMRVEASTRANGIATATVSIHPNRHAYRLTRGLNVFVVCRMVEVGVDAAPVNRVMFSGDVTSVQVMSQGKNRDYVLQLTDNRKYMTELPTYYLKLIRTNNDKENGKSYRSPLASDLGKEGAAEGYTGSDGIVSIYDDYADANFYGIGGLYSAQTYFYDITDNRVKMMINNVMGKNTLDGYINKMLEPLNDQKGWEPYYVNMNKKKRITDNLKIQNEGLYQAAIKAEYAEAAWQSVKDAHVELNTTYEDALGRLNELGYVFNTNLFPSLTGGMARKIDLNSSPDPYYHIKSALLPGELVNIVRIAKTDTDTTRPKNGLPYAMGKSLNGVYHNAVSPMVYSADQGDYTYYAIINRERDHAGKEVNTQARLREFAIFPKMYGLLPPKCNWAVLQEGMNFQAMIGEPPLTALKYTLKDGFTNVSTYTCAYPGGLEFYSLYTVPITAALEEYGEAEGTALGGTNKYSQDDGKTYTEATEAAIKKYVPTGYQGLIRAIIWVESRGNPNVVSSAKAIGLMQVIAKWHADPRVQRDGNMRLYNEDYNIWAGYVHFYNWLRIRKGNLALALKSYNAGYIEKRGAEANKQADEYYRLVNARYKMYTGQDLPGVAILQPVLGSAYDDDNYTPGESITYLKDMAAYKYTEVGEEKEVKFDINVGSGSIHINKYMSYGVKNKRHFEDEHIYGVKRVSTTGSAVYELEKAAQYAEPDGDIATQASAPASATTPPQTSASATAPKPEQSEADKVQDALSRALLKNTPEGKKEARMLSELLKQLRAKEGVSATGNTTLPTTATGTAESATTGTGTNKSLVLSRQQKFDMIKQKTKKDYYEATVSQNSAMLIINGLAEEVLVGLPYILYYPPHELFYYGFVEAVKHCVDNSAGEAYTEITLTGVSSAKTIGSITNRFSGYLLDKYVPKKGKLNAALSALNKMYSLIACTDNITAEEYGYFDLTKPTNGENLIKLLTARPGHRNICTLERLQNYYYDNKETVASLAHPASNQSKARQWMTPAMRDATQDLIDEYAASLMTSLVGRTIELDQDAEEEQSVLGPDITDNELKGDEPVAEEENAINE